ncbi:MAG TPA: ATP-binding protein [Flavobacterium sp.]|nr:ATP-binding protein [Flavobacterium sp.]
MLRYSFFLLTISKLTLIVIRNKELMRIFKDLDLVEQLGSGIPRVLQAYAKDSFHFSENFLRVTLPSMEALTRTEQVTEQVRLLISSMADKKYSSVELMELVGIKHRPTFLYNYLQPALKSGLIALTIPDKSTSRNQKYYLTEKGKTTHKSLE